MEKWSVTCLSLVLLICSVQDIFAKTRLKVFWVAEEHEVSPNTLTHWTNDSHEWLLYGNKVGNNPIGQVLDSKGKNGVSYIRQTNFRGGAITFKEQWNGIILSIVVTTVANGCRASVLYHKFPGQKYFINTKNNDSTPMYESSIKANGVVCEIRQEE